MSKAKPLLFVDVPRQDPTKKSVQARVAEFGEIYGQYDAGTAATQAGRCLLRLPQRCCPTSPECYDVTWGKEVAPKPDGIRG